MTFTEFISKRDASSPPSNPQPRKKRPRLSRQNQFHPNGAFKKLHTSVLDLLHVHHTTDNLENKDIYHEKQQEKQQQPSKEPIPPRPSIIKSSDIARVLAKKSVTFASVFESVDNENTTTSQLEPIDDSDNDNDMTAEEDLVTVVKNSPIINDRTTTEETTEAMEPYPFRSEIPAYLSSSSTSPTDSNTNTTQRSRKKIIDRFTPHHRPKKLRHPLQTNDPISPKNRSSSAPNLTSSSYSSTTPTRAASIPTNTPQDSPQTNTHTRFKLSNIVQFIRSFKMHSHKKQKNDTVKTKVKSTGNATELRPHTELLY